MGIIVVDQAPELYWFVSSALQQEEIPLKHVQTASGGENIILSELPEIVIFNGDDRSLQPAQFINKMRNHVFARNTLFIVITSDTSIEYKKALLIAGAGQVLYRGQGFNPSPKFFASLIKWFKNFKTPDPLIFDFKPVAFTADADFISFGRIGWVSSTHCLIETNVDIKPGQTIQCSSPLFDELEIKNSKLECVEKNKIGRFYQYSNSILCKIVSKDPEKDAKKLEAWIKNNESVSKAKPVKVIYFENEAIYRDQIKQMIKFDKRYCARGYADISEAQEVLEYQQPHLILINRAIIQKDKPKFDAIKNYVKTNSCYCVTYSTSELFGVEEFKKEYDFAMHCPGTIEVSLLESMIQKLEIKLKKELKINDKAIYLSKHSAYSRLNLLSPCKITEIALCGISIELPFFLSNFCACEISSSSFSVANMGRAQFFRTFYSKPSAATGKGNYHRMIFMGQNTKDNEQVKTAIDLITIYGYERWLRGDAKGDP